MILQGEIARTKVVATNAGAAAVEITFIPTCTCLTVFPSAASVPPGGSAAFDLSFDSKDDYGITQRGFIVASGEKGSKPLYFELTGVVRVERAEGAAVGPSSRPPALPAQARSLQLQYYYTPGCRSCEQFLSVELPRLEERYGLRLDVARRDLLQGSAYEELSAFASSLGTGVSSIPALRVDGILLQGDDEIRARLPGILVTSAAGGSLALAAPTSTASGPAANLSALPVMAAGLVDGLNPCAFTTLIFLLASLALAGRGRMEVLVIGALFTLSVFLTYLGVGLGLFAAIRAASALSLVSTILRWALAALLVAFSALSVYDYTRVRAGAPAKMILQLPDSLKLRIHSSIRNRAKAAALAGSSLAMGFFVSIFEFACTAQVYLPTLAYLARAEKRRDALGLLLLYNLCFILPLLVVFAASYFGASSKRITALFQRHLGKLKLALALVFLGLAALTLLT
jgi:cytochrome c biogenesis protein CcdA